MATLFNNFFQSTFTKITNINRPPPVLIDHDAHLSDIILTPNEVTKELKNLNASKAPGPDNIPTLILKECAHELSPSITDLVNDSLSTGEVPTNWKKLTLYQYIRKEISIYHLTIGQFHCYQ